MKKTIILVSLLAVFAYAFGQQEEVENPARAWTNKAGKTIFAQFVEANDETVTISVRGQRHVLKLADLSEKSQSLLAFLEFCREGGGGEG